MKKLIHKIGKAVRSKKGESLMESVVSMLILAILLLAVATMTQTALKMTGMSTQKAEEMQEAEYNPLMLSVTDGNEMNITFSSTAAGISASHKINFTGSGIIAFDPK